MSDFRGYQMAEAEWRDRMAAMRDSNDRWAEINSEQNARIAALEAALRGMLKHSCVADAGAEDKLPEDIDAEREARAALAPAPAPAVGEVEFRRGLEAAAKMAETQPPMVGEARYWGKEIAGRIRALAPAPAPEVDPVCPEAADAIAALVARVAELEVESKANEENYIFWHGAAMEYEQRAGTAEARAAALEAGQK